MTDDIRDFGIAVTDAERLNVRYHELAESFAARPSVAGDEHRLIRRVQISPAAADDNGWVHRCNSQDVAVAYIRGGIIGRQLPIWIRTATDDQLVDHYQFVTVTYHMVATGTYMTDNLPKGPMEHRPLWVKNADWRAYFDAVMFDRYGTKELPQQAPEDLSLRKMSDLEIIRIARAAHAEGFKGRLNTKEVCRRTGATDSAVKLLTKGIFLRVGRRGSGK